MVALCCINPFQGACSLWCQAYETYESIFQWKIREHSSSSQDKSITGGNLGLPKTHLFHQEQILSHVFFLIFDLWKLWSIFGPFGPWIPVVWDEIGGLVDPNKTTQKWSVSMFSGLPQIVFRQCHLDMWKSPCSFLSSKKPQELSKLNSRCFGGQQVGYWKFLKPRLSPIRNLGWIKGRRCRF